MKSTDLTVEEFAAKVKEIISLGVAEIIKNGIHSYTFRVSTIWYEVAYYNNYGMDIQIHKGESCTATTDLMYTSVWLKAGSSLRKDGDLFFNTLEKIYISHLVFKSEKVINALKNYIVLISKCTSIEKLSQNVFTIVVNNIKYIFELNDRYSIESGMISPILEIKYLSNNEFKIRKIEGYKNIDSIFSVLNAIYYLNKTEDNEFTENEILELFN